MRVTKILIMLFIPAIMLLAGCKLVEEPIAVDVSPQPQPVLVPDHGDESIERRFTDPQDEATNVVQSALMWSQKYEELSTKAEKLREQNNAQFIENNDLKRKLAELQGELDRTKAELGEANAFLRQMQMELTKWKADVLGFRDETRSAQAAQLEALTKILRILGAEPVEPSETETQPQTEQQGNK
jgi:chromosome segregation ATPase